ncbi:MAG: FAD-dependent oxidoreductase [Deltaproteobacteria bacterium]|nr:FAD-dependent oxidoreductase [Deltaproteobacteria bacterium]
MPPERYGAVVERIRAWTPSTRSLFLRPDAGARMPFHAGQFISLALPVGESPPLVRPYSLASDPEDALLEICVDLVPAGIGSRYLFSLAVGATLDLKGPFGSFMVDAPPAAAMVFVADGTGIAPVRAMVRRVLAHGGEHRVQVLHGAPTEADLLFHDELAAFGSHPRFSWEPVLAGAGAATGENPKLEALVLDRYVRADADRTRHFWICAVGDLVRRLREALRAAGYERRAVRYEQW